MTLTLELAGLTGLDAASVEQQVIPHLETYTSPEPLRVYLESLVGSSVTARSFIQNYLITRFGSAHHRQKPSRASPGVPTPASSSGAALSSVSQNSRPSSNKGKARQPDPTEAEALNALNPEELSQVNEIDRSLKLLSLPEGHPLLQKSKCFCQGRRHPLSSYVRLCPSCGLVLCSLNLPSRPCPSCLTGPLLTSQQLFNHKTTQLSRREVLLSEGRERFLLAQQIENEERQRMMFPSLADRANGLSDVQHRINTAYTDNDTSRRVLSLDLKTKKVSQTTTRKKKPVAASRPSNIAADDQRDLGLDQLRGWIDPSDDGYARQVRQGKAPAVPAALAPALVHYIPRGEQEPEDEQPLSLEDHNEASDAEAEPAQKSADESADKAAGASTTNGSKGQQPAGSSQAKQKENGEASGPKRSRKAGKGKHKIPGQA